jgi:hypothetical protein
VLILVAAVMVVSAVGVVTMIISLDLGDESTSSPPSTTLPMSDGPELSGAGASADDAVGLGESGDTGDDWALQVTSVNLEADDAVRIAGRNDPPQPGTRFVIVTLKASYLGAESGTSFGRLMSVFGSDGIERSRTVDIPSPPGPVFVDSKKVGTGGTIEGNVIFVVGETETGLMLRTTSADGRQTWFSLQ